jgi:ribosomal protein S26
VKKVAKMVHNKVGGDTGRKKTIKCGQCGADMAWAKVVRRMKYVCMNCSHGLER